jgi:hypothetical protein
VNFAEVPFEQCSQKLLQASSLSIEQESQAFYFSLHYPVK